MAQAAEVKVRGIRQLQAGTRILIANIETATDRQALPVTADQATATIRQNVPRLTGRLAATVRTIRADPVQVSMGGSLPYARWIEFGRYRGRAPRGGRYVYPTAKRTTNALRKHCQTTTAQEIRRMRWPPPM